MKKVLITTFAMFALISTHAQKSTSLSSNQNASKAAKVENRNGAKSLSESAQSNTQVPMSRKTATQPAVRKEEKIKND